MADFLSNLASRSAGLSLPSTSEPFVAPPESTKMTSNDSEAAFDGDDRMFAGQQEEFVPITRVAISGDAAPHARHAPIDATETPIAASLVKAPTTRVIEDTTAYRRFDVVDEDQVDGLISASPVSPTNDHNVTQASKNTPS